MTVSGIAVFDIDGVVADVRHRLHYLTRRPKDWDGFFRAASDDPPLEVGINLVGELATQHRIVWLTGRPTWLRELTQEWLQALGLDTTSLHMRPVHDRRPARLYKLEVLHRLAPQTIAAFIDDDDEVVRSAQAAGFAAVLADWVPRGAALRMAQDEAGRS